MSETPPIAKNDAPLDPGEHLARYKAGLRLTDCTCPWSWVSYGRVYGLDMGKGWGRSGTAPECPHHGHEAQRRREAASRLPRIGKRTRVTPPAKP